MRSVCVLCRTILNLYCILCIIIIVFEEWRSGLRRSKVYYSIDRFVSRCEKAASRGRARSPHTGQPTPKRAAPPSWLLRTTRLQRQPMMFLLVTSFNSSSSSSTFCSSQVLSYSYSVFPNNPLIPTTTYDISVHHRVLLVV